MTRGRREIHKRTCRRLILAFLVVIMAGLATAAIKGNMGQQEGQERAEILKRLSWMFKVKDCRHACLFCEYFDMCRADGIPEKEDKVK